MLDMLTIEFQAEAVVVWPLKSRYTFLVAVGRECRVKACAWVRVVRSTVLGCFVDTHGRRRSDQYQREAVAAGRTRVEMVAMRAVDMALPSCCC